MHSNNVKRKITINLSHTSVSVYRGIRWLVKKKGVCIISKSEFFISLCRLQALQCLVCPACVKIPQCRPSSCRSSDSWAPRPKPIRWGFQYFELKLIFSRVKIKHSLNSETRSLQATEASTYRLCEEPILSASLGSNSNRESWSRNLVLICLVCSF